MIELFMLTSFANLQSTKKLWPPSIKEGSSSFESSDQERINDWYFDDGDDVTTDEVGSYSYIAMYVC